MARIGFISTLQMTACLVGLMCFSSCVKEANLDLDFKPSLVVFSTISPNYLFQNRDSSRAKVIIGKTKNPNDNSDFVSLSDAEIEMTQRARSGPSVFEKYNPKCDCFSNNKIIIEEGNTYSLKASSPGFDTVYSETTIPKASKASNGFIKDYKMDFSVKNEDKINISYNLKFRLDHDIDAEYYHLLFHNEFSFTNGGGYYYTLNPIYSDGFAYTKHYDSGILVKREDLENRNIALRFSDYTYEDEPLAAVLVEIRTVNKDYYQYHESISRQRIVRQDPFAEPVTIFNNIENGFGNFSAYNLSILSIPLEN